MHLLIETVILKIKDLYSEGATFEAKTLEKDLASIGVSLDFSKEGIHWSRD